MSSEALEAIRRRHAAPTSGPWDTSRGTLSGYVTQARADVLALLAEVARLEQAHAKMEASYEVDIAALERAEAALAVAREREQRLREAGTALLGWADDPSYAPLDDGSYRDVVAAFRAALVDEPAAAGAGHNLCACGSTLIVCAKCGDSRCLVCDPYDELDTCGATEPEAATLAEPGKARSTSGRDADEAAGSRSAPGSASGAADEPASAVVWSEPRQDFPGGRIYRDGLATGTPSAAADDGRCPGCGWYVADCNCVAAAAADELGETP